MCKITLFLAVSSIALILLVPNPSYAEYNPTTGRFLQRDPIGYLSGSNLYNYVTSNPIKYPDPFGLKETPNKPDKKGSDYCLEQIGFDFNCLDTACIKVARYINCMAGLADDYKEFVTGLFGTTGGGIGTNAIEQIEDEYKRQFKLKAKYVCPDDCTHGFKNELMRNGLQNFRHFAGALRWGPYGKWADNRSNRSQLRDAWDEYLDASSANPPDWEKMEEAWLRIQEVNAEIIASNLGAKAMKEILAELNKYGSWYKFNHRDNDAWRKVRGLPASFWIDNFCKKPPWPIPSWGFIYKEFN